MAKRVRVLGVMLAVGVLVPGLALAAPAGAGGAGSPVAEPDPSAVPVARDDIEPAPVLRGRPEVPPVVVPPAPGAAEVDVVPGAGAVRAGELPVRVAASASAAPGAALVGPTRVRVEVLGSAERDGLGAQGLALRVSQVGLGERPVALSVEVDYSALVGFSGGGWEARLQLVQFDGCASSPPPGAKVAAVEAVTTAVEQLLGGNPSESTPPCALVGRNWRTWTFVAGAGACILASAGTCGGVVLAGFTARTAATVK